MWLGSEKQEQRERGSEGEIKLEEKKIFDVKINEYKKK